MNNYIDNITTKTIKATKNKGMTFLLAKHYGSKIQPKLNWFESDIDRRNYLIIHFVGLFERAETTFLSRSPIRVLKKELTVDTLKPYLTNPEEFISDMLHLGDNNHLTEDMVEALEHAINHKAHYEASLLLDKLYKDKSCYGPDENAFTIHDVESELPFIILRPIPDDFAFVVMSFKHKEERDVKIKEGDMLHCLLPDISE